MMYLITFALRPGDKVLLNNGKLTRTVDSVQDSGWVNWADEPLYTVTYTEGATPGIWSGGNTAHGQHNWVVVERGS